MFIDIIFIIIFLSLLIFVHEAGHFLAAKFFGMRVDEFGIGFPPRFFSRKMGETVYSLNWLPLGGFVKIYGENPAESVEGDPRAFNYQNIWKRFVVISAGVAMNFVFGWLVLSAVFMIGSEPSLLITGVQPDSPAELAGLDKGDKILTIESGSEKLENPESSRQFIDFVDRFRGKEFGLKIDRGGEIMILSVGSRANPSEGEGAIGIGIVSTGIEARPFFASLKEGFRESVGVAQAVIGAIYKLFFVEPGLFKDVVGPPGIFSFAAEANRAGFAHFLNFMGVISVNLAVLNYLPIPALDGGRIVLLIIEKLKRSPIPPKIEQSVNTAGMAVLLAFLAFVTVRDIINFF